MESLLQFPVPPQVLPAILLLQFGPWQFNVMGLYVVLLLASPLILAALNRGQGAVGAGRHRWRSTPRELPPGSGSCPPSSRTPSRCWCGRCCL